MEILTSILNPGVLFFILGLLAILLNSNLSIPESVVKFVSIYLMLSIGFRGGVSLHGTSILGDGMIILFIIIAMSAFVPIYSYFLLKKKLGTADACAIGATYGSNSTLTYITAAGFLTSIGVAFDGYMTVALVVMETPAIVIGIVMAQLSLKGKGTKTTGQVIKEALTDGTLLVLVGSMGIGYLLTALGTEKSPLATFIGGDMFTGMLVFFLLYMGTVVGKKIKEIESFPLILLTFSPSHLLTFSPSHLLTFSPSHLRHPRHPRPDSEWHYRHPLRFLLLHRSPSHTERYPPRGQSCQIPDHEHGHHLPAQHRN